MVPFLGLALFLPLQIVPMWDSLNMRIVGAWPYGRDRRGKYLVTDSLLYVGTGSGLYLYDISDPHTPRKLDSFKFGFLSMDFERAGNWLYIASWKQGVVVWDVSRPERPSRIGYHLTPDITYGLCVADTLLYVAAYEAGLRILNCADPHRPVEVGFWDTPGQAGDVALRGTHCYLADGYGGFRVLDVSDPTHPQELFSRVIERQFAGAISLAETLAVIAWGDSGLRIWNVSNPALPREVGVLKPPGFDFVAVEVKESLAFATATFVTGLRGRDTMLIVSIAHPSAPRVLAGCPGGSRHLTLWRNLCIVSNPDVDWQMGKVDSVYILDVSDPSQPVLLGACTGFYRYLDALSATGGLAFGGYRGQGLRVFDVSSPAEPRLLSQLGDWWVSDIAVTGNLVHLACYNGLPYRLVDVSDPRNPVVLGTLDSGGAFYRLVARDTLVFATGMISSSWGLWILSIAHPSAPRVLARIPGASNTYTDCALDGNLLYFADYRNGLRIFDVTDPSRPQPLGECQTLGGSMDIKVRYPYVYIADGYGLSVYDVRDPSNPFFVATYPANYGYFGVDLDRNIAYAADGWWGVCAIDISDPTNPRTAGYYYTPCFAAGVCVADGLVYVADEEGWYILEYYGAGIAERNGGVSSDGRLRVKYIPGSATLKVRLPEAGARMARLEIYNLAGERVYQSSVGGRDEVEIAPVLLPSGVHFAVVSTARSRHIAKFLVVR